MKTIKRIFLSCTLALFVAASASAAPLDERQRTVETVIADCLAQLPAPTVKEYDKIMGELAATGAEGIEMLAGMLVPATQGKNAPVEYAINGTASYVSKPGQETLRKGVCEGLLAALARCTDNANRAFLLAQLQICASADEADAIGKYFDDPYLSDYALRTLISIPESEATLLALAERPGTTQEQKAALAYAFGEKEVTEAEQLLLSWLPDADETTRTAIYTALGSCGSTASLKSLAAAARAAGYIDDKTAAADSYLRLLNRLVDQKASREAIKAAKKLLGCNASNVRGAALQILLRAQGTEALPYVLKALQTDDIQYRNAALWYIEEFADDGLYATIAAERNHLSDDAWADVIEWFGVRHATSQTAAVTEAVASPNDRLALAGIHAAGRLGGDEALAALIAALGGKHADAATQALLAFNGKIDEGVVKALDGEGTMPVQALGLAAARRITAVSDKVFALLDAADPNVSEAAYRALSSVTTPDDIGRLSDRIDRSDDTQVEALRSALMHAAQPLAPEKQYETIAAKMNASEHPERYYPVLAQSGTQQAIDCLLENFAGKHAEEAFAALLLIDNPQMIGVLRRLAEQHPELADRALARYTGCVAALDATPVRKYQLYSEALALNPSAKIVNKILRELADIHEIPALLLAGGYLDNPETARTAAAVVKTIGAKGERLAGGEKVRSLLEKSCDIYRDWAASDADAGYAVDELTLMLSKLPADGFRAVTGDLAQWTAAAAAPTQRAAMNPAARKRAETAAAKAMQRLWKDENGVISYLGGEASAIAAPYTCENFEMWIDFRTAGKAGLAVRSTNRIGLGDGAGSGAATGNRIYASTPDTNADNEKGAWNTLYLKMVDDRITIEVNGRTVTDNVILENSGQPDKAVPVAGTIELLGEGDAIDFRNILLHELPATPLFELPAEEAEAGYEVLFDGRSLHNWTGNTTNYVPQEGTIYVTAQYGGSGNLYTKKEYGDFVLRFEFRFLREGVNNGIGIRTPMGVDAAYHGMEIQILDHDAPIYKNLRIYQQHGSVYGIIPAKRIKFGPLGTWNVEEIRATGDHITVTVNGEVILDGNIREACQGHNVSEDGSKTNPYTVDHRNHPGLFNKKGHIGLLGHGAGIQFRNIRILDLGTEEHKN